MKKVIKIGDSVSKIEISFKKVQRKGRIKNARKFKVPRDAAQLVVKTPSTKTKKRAAVKPKKSKPAKGATTKKKVKPTPKTYIDISSKDILSFTDKEIRDIEENNDKIISESFMSANKKKSIIDRYDDFVNELKKRKVPISVIDRIIDNSEGSFRLDIEDALIVKIGEKRFRDFCLNFHKQFRQKQFDNVKEKLNVSYVLKQKGMNVSFGDPVYDFSYFGFFVYPNKKKYKLLVNTKIKGGKQYNPYHTEIHEAITADEAAVIMESEAKRMFTYGNALVPVSVYVKYLKKINKN